MYSGDSCVDINECLSGEDNCDPNGLCINKVPGFNCSCNEDRFWFGNGINCYYHEKARIALELFNS